MLELKNISFNYKKSEKKILDDINYSFAPGMLYAVYGPSGSGKTTLLSLLGGLDKPGEGELFMDGNSYSQIGYSALRRSCVAFVFQSYQLMGYMTALENVLLAMDIGGGSPKKERRELALSTLKDLGLADDEINRKVKKLSGGQQQRVGIARALAGNAPYILADEPTGNLDRETAMGIMEIFGRLSHKQQKCVIMVTHSPEMKAHCDICLELIDGKLTEEENT